MIVLMRREIVNNLGEFISTIHSFERLIVSFKEKYGEKSIEVVSEIGINNIYTVKIVCKKLQKK